MFLYDKKVYWCRISVLKAYSKKMQLAELPVYKGSGTFLLGDL